MREAFLTIPCAASLPKMHIYTSQNLSFQLL